MNSRIKFRAWNKKHQQMWYNGGHMDLRITLDGIIGSDDNYYGYDLSEDFELTQFTGLHDVNGKGIFEGDLVEHDNETLEVVWGGQWNYKAFGLQRKRHKNEFGSKPYTWDCLNDNYEKKIKIIGNIYENADIMEGIK